MTQKAIGRQSRWIRRLASSLVLFALIFTVGLKVEARNPDVPFPLEAQLPFPWGTIEGMWEAHQDGVNALFSFQVQSASDGRKILKVIHLNPETYDVVAQGTGISVDEKKMTAAMVTAKGNYWLVIRAYKDEKAKMGSKVATVLTVRPFTGTEEDEIHVVVRKISNTPFVIPSNREHSACDN